MKTSVFRSLSSVRAFLIVAVSVALCAPCAFAQSVIFSDNFQGYTDDASLLATWTRVSGTISTISLAPDPLDPANQAIQQTTSAGRLRHVIPGTTPTADNPLSFSFDFYDSNGGTTSSRMYGEIRNSGTASGLFAAGIYSSATSGYDVTRYQARNVDNGNWIQLSTVRSVGWHNFRFEISANTASLYIDGVVDPNFNSLSYSGNISYDWVHIGSALSGNFGAYFDNVDVSLVPEPSPLVLGLLGIGALLVRTCLRRNQA